ncbi:MAG TPA: hypothetical protein VEF34_00495 [Syntrophobacteraceae bacterium]|nr:hypothetical protein [Syntrophobacteraceae bacterium]
MKKKLTRHGTIRTEASINREIACLHHVFEKAADWDMMERNPFDRGKTLLFKKIKKGVTYRGHLHS